MNETNVLLILKIAVEEQNIADRLRPQINVLSDEMLNKKCANCDSAGK